MGLARCAAAMFVAMLLQWPTIVYGFPPTQTWMTFKSYGCSPLIEYKLPRIPCLSRAVRSALAALSYSDTDFVGYRTQTPATVRIPTGDLFIRSNFGTGEASGCSIHPPSPSAASILSKSLIGSISTVAERSKGVPANGLIASAISWRCVWSKSRGAIFFSRANIFSCRRLVIPVSTPYNSADIKISAANPTSNSFHPVCCTYLENASFSKYTPSSTIPVENINDQAKPPLAASKASISACSDILGELAIPTSQFFLPREVLRC
jgi:hypothetical protein